MTRPFSLVILAHNAAGLLPDGLASVPGAAEVLMVDSGGTDDMVAVATELGA